MHERKRAPISPGALVLRALACLLLAGSLAMLFFPWVSLRLNDSGGRVTLREMALRSQQMGALSFRDRFLVPLGQRDEGLYAGALTSLDPLADDRMSPLQTGLACLSASKWLDEYSGTYRQNGPSDPETDSWAQGLQSTALGLRLTGSFLLVLVLLLLITGVYAVYSAAVGYGLGLLPYFLSAVPGLLGAALGAGRCNAWYQSSSGAARLLRTVIDSYSVAGNPVTAPFRMGFGGILFGFLLAAGLLFALCALERKAPEAGPAPVRTASSSAPAPERRAPARPLPNSWRCPSCGTLMGDGVYCVKCGTRKPEPRRCAGCGAILPETGSFCSWCGTPVPKRTEPFASAAAPQSPTSPDAAAPRPLWGNGGRIPVDTWTSDDLDR